MKKLVKESLNESNLRFEYGDQVCSIYNGEDIIKSIDISDFQGLLQTAGNLEDDDIRGTSVVSDDGHYVEFSTDDGIIGVTYDELQSLPDL